MIDRREFRAANGDLVVLTRMDGTAGRPPSVMVTLDDVDDSTVPTVELTLSEAEQLARLLAVVARHPCTAASNCELASGHRGQCGR